MLEALSGTGKAQVHQLVEEEKETEEIRKKKKFPFTFKIFYD